MKGIIDYKFYNAPDLVGLYELIVDGTFKYGSTKLDNVLKYADEIGVEDIVIL